MNDAFVENGPQFSAAFNHDFELLLKWRRDVRHFKQDIIDRETVDELLRLTDLSPSVGNSQPWRFIEMSQPANREAVYLNFQQANSEALKGYKGERAESYTKLKLQGLTDAPLQFAVFCDLDPTQGGGLGRQTMPETLAYSCVSAINCLWLAARAKGIGVGWVSILNPDSIGQLFGVPENWKFVAYLCIGYPCENNEVPELQRTGWQARTATELRMLKDIDLVRPEAKQESSSCQSK
ncbi:5,6-dimethylbenzimidazole synthase [Pseudovibrio sp. W64]|uniref:5,6-dimethylbenzimidazole synthase n=2 Tax=unclassified Pseudovibrio TaxID=2627060 RepID=UPI00070F146A|nr:MULTISPECIES: 5,6-dimethylbenzimidazole synthase [unclassified Pseudovibrio]KZK77160.1 5,6-dimethylbenzimidazole synthase [Pseudovibrio sp. Ad46]KZK80582.1 5,6-dimethylbenzimidazole synthase [Pseudovibrio sp. Ad13]KZK86834.1 5,6-dimethylbenzimidazole synthase [Pseudovibrio sp. W64]KZK89653.1 5,6-dimethylbenzimidazole synthase [Pseudovibrio sp. Ad5]KZL03139.1 5,6-dimethylbenzimidazole synthase [Pseudovibrio sp. W74]